MSFLSNLMGKSPEDQVKEWIRRLRREQRQVEMQVSRIQREQAKVQTAMKQAAKKEDPSLRILATELVHSRKAVNRLYAAKAKMNSVSMELSHQMAQVKMMHAMGQSTEIMREMNSLIRIPEVCGTMQAMSKEMCKAGMMGEMVNDTLDSALGNDDIDDEELETEVNKVVEEITLQAVGSAGVGRSKIPTEKEKVSADNDLIKRLEML